MLLRVASPRDDGSTTGSFSPPCQAPDRISRRRVRSRNMFEFLMTIGTATEARCCRGPGNSASAISHGSRQRSGLGWPPVGWENDSAKLAIRIVVAGTSGWLRDQPEPAVIVDQTFTTTRETLGACTKITSASRSKLRSEIQRDSV
jgi:hypothetical protein